MLNIIKEIKKTSLQDVVNRYSLKFKDYGHKFLLKYDQLNTPKNPSTDECRGLVLDYDLNVISFPLKRFHNLTSNDKVDWNNARIFEKVDGTMIQYYYDYIAGKWCVGTTGTAEAIDPVVTIVDGKRVEQDFNFSELFWNTCEQLEVDLDLVKGYTYIFELVTPYNEVVNSYDEPTVTLLACRNLETLEEIPMEDVELLGRDMNCKTLGELVVNSYDELMNSLRNVSNGDWNFEGYVIVDSNNNRWKVKSNMYVIHAQLKGDLKSKWRLMDVVINNEIDEVIATIPEVEDDIRKLESKYNDVIKPLEKVFNELKTNRPSERKDYFLAGSAALGFNRKYKMFLGVISQLLEDESISFIDALNNINKKAMYKALKS